MCGGYALLAKSKGDLNSYHMGRLTTYLSLGLLVSSLGAWLLKNEIVSFVSSLVFLGYLIWTAVKIFKKEHLHLALPKFLRDKIQNLNWSKQNSFCLGVLSTAVPCGWLYIFLFAAFQSGHMWMGLYYMWVFWLGTLPVFAVLKRYVPVSSSSRASIVLLIIGLCTFWMRLEHLSMVNHNQKQGLMVQALCAVGLARAQ